MTVPILVRRLPHGEGLPLPTYATAGAAGMDLLAWLETPEGQFATWAAARDVSAAE